MIKRPVFIIGTGRSGTTLFFNVLAHHPDFAWFSNYSGFFPNQAIVASFARIFNLPIVGVYVPKSFRLIPKPVESYAMLNYCTKGMFTNHGMLDESDVSDEIRHRYRKVVEDYLAYQGKPRYLQKHTGFARIRYLKSIFPEALFIHVLRDGRAIANSLINVEWWSGDLKTCWWWGKMRNEYMLEYQKSKNKPLILACIVWKTLMDLIEEESRELSNNQLLTIRYDDMIKDLPLTMKKVIQFCGLEQSEQFARHVSKTQTINMDLKWEKKLSRNDKNIINSCLERDLIKFGFTR